MAAESAFPANTRPRITKPLIRFKEKPSPFDATVSSHNLPVGEHRLTGNEIMDQTAFTDHIVTQRVTPASACMAVFVPGRAIRSK